MPIEGTIRIHRSIGGTEAPFRVSFVPYSSDGESAEAMRSFREVQHVRAFLKSLGIRQDIITDALRQIAAGRSASLPSVSLSDDVVKNAGLELPAPVAKK
jgi:hypothetical protein